MNCTMQRSWWGRLYRTLRLPCFTRELRLLIRDRGWSYHVKRDTNEASKLIRAWHAQPLSGYGVYWGWYCSYL